MSTLLPPVVRTLHERLRFRYWGPQRVVRFDAFILDLADWKLSLADRTPCLWIHEPDHLNAPSADLTEEVRDAVRQQNWQNETILVLVDGSADELRRYLSGSFPQFVVLDDRQQKEIADAPSPSRVMLDFMLAQMPRSRLAPYETSRPVIGSRFFGRQSYLKKILGHPRTNFLITGIRRIGKSSLLREVERLLDLNDPPGENQRRRLYIDCSVITTPEEFYREIVSRLSPPDLKRLLGRSAQSLRFQSQMFEYLADRHGGLITYLLDEIDRLLEHLGDDLSLFDVLRKVSLQEGSARFIMAGFREARRATSDQGTPFFNFAETLSLEALDRLEVKHMVEWPMDQLRVKLQGRDEIVQRIYRETAGQPNLVQFYCQTMLEQLDRTEGGVNALSVESLRWVYDNANFRDLVLQTFLANSLPLERAIAFAMVDAAEGRVESFSLREIDAELEARGVRVNLNALDDACRSLEAAGVFQKSGREFAFRIPLFARMLDENYPVDFAFEKTRRELAETEKPQ